MKKRMIAGLLACMLFMGAAWGETENGADLSPEQVYQLEERLSALGFLPSVHDDIFNDETRMALGNFQKAHDLPVTGIPDEATLEKLNGGEAMTKQGYLSAFAGKYANMEPLSKGISNSMVVALQKKLKELGYFSNDCDSLYGDATQSAVERFQMANGLPATGIADGMTMMRLMEGTPILWQDFLAEMESSAGKSGLNVYVLQRKLRQMGYFQGDCTGNFGDLTQKAVVEFQGNNQLETTGNADAATWAVIYSGKAVAPRKEDVMQIGDFGEAVQQAQQRLAELGYYKADITGEFTTSMETAVRLCQMGNGFEITGELDKGMLELLNTGAILPVNDEAVTAAFDAIMAGLDGGVFLRISDIANRMLGASFEELDADLYPGFAFVQYVCVAAGVPVTGPEALIHLTDQKVEAGENLPEGNIVVFQSATGDSVSIMLTISGGGDKIIYATAAGGWVVLSHMDQMAGSNIYRWGEKVEISE